MIGNHADDSRTVPVRLISTGLSLAFAAAAKFFAHTGASRPGYERRISMSTFGSSSTACVAALCHHLAQPVPGLGIALPIFVPAIATAIVALVLSRQHAATLAYVGGSLGTLIGADLLNLGSIQGLGAPVASIGGAGTFDGIFVTGMLAVIIASLPPMRVPGPMSKDA